MLQQLGPFEQYYPDDTAAISISLAYYRPGIHETDSFFLN